MHTTTHPVQCTTPVPAPSSTPFGLTHTNHSYGHAEFQLVSYSKPSCLPNTPFKVKVQGF